jgi:hypothetical protein
LTREGGPTIYHPAAVGDLNPVMLWCGLPPWCRRASSRARDWDPHCTGRAAAAGDVECVRTPLWQVASGVLVGSILSGAAFVAIGLGLASAAPLLLAVAATLGSSDSWQPSVRPGAA